MGKLFAVGVLALSLGACSASADKETAERGVVAFHRMLDGERYHDIYANAANEFRQTGSEESAVQFLRNVHDRLGSVRSTSEQGWRVNYGTAGHIVNLSYATEFASGRGIENFVFRMNGNSAQLIGYHLNSNDMMTSSGPEPVVQENSAPDRSKEPTANETSVIRPARR